MAVRERTGETVTVHGARRLEGEIDLPGDPDISLMALSVAARSEGQSEIHTCSRRPKVQAFEAILGSLGISCEAADDSVSVQGGDLGQAPGPLDAGASAVALGCLAGLMGGATVGTDLTADSDLSACASKLLEALKAMGLRPAESMDEILPMRVGGRPLRSGSHQVGVPDTAVKCAMLLAALGVEGTTEVLQETSGDDDLEVLLKTSGAAFEKGRVEGAEGHRIALTGPAALQATRHDLPGDATAALFALLTASLLKRSEVSIRRAGVDYKTRRMQDLVRRMDVSFQMTRTRTGSGFHTRQLDVKVSDLRSIKIAGPYSSLLMDELPLFAAAAAGIYGETIIRDAGRLREGGVDRIDLLVEALRLMGARVGEIPDGMVVKGESRLQGVEVDAGGDAQVTLAMMLAGLIAEGETTIWNAGPVEETFPGIYERVNAIAVR